MSSRSRWQRLPQGYLSRDGEWFLERGAPMSDGNTNAWMILRRVTEDRVGRDGGSAYDQRGGGALWALDAEGFTRTRPADTTDPLYAHDWDAGSLAEAKHTVNAIETEEANR